jgi:hypothetical protein
LNGMVGFSLLTEYRGIGQLTNRDYGTLQRTLGH